MAFGKGSQISNTSVSSMPSKSNVKSLVWWEAIDIVLRSRRMFEIEVYSALNYPNHDLKIISRVRTILYYIYKEVYENIIKIIF
jgi:glucose-6-phosphate-specific signal transduction histidine kinase